jgi:lipid II:glycine glycyltransferase (peptidoglycan interpeptide bridge formation enzyme)
MCWAKSHGCRSYDLYGIPDAPLETLETEFLNRHDGLWGVYRFKRGFGGEVVRSMGAFDFVYKPQLYKWLLYTTLTRLIDRRSAQNAGA